MRQSPPAGHPPGEIAALFGPYCHLDRVVAGGVGGTCPPPKKIQKPVFIPKGLHGSVGKKIGPLFWTKYKGKILGGHSPSKILGQGGMSPPPIKKGSDDPGGMAQFLTTPMGVRKLDHVLYGGSAPQTNHGGRGRGTPPPPGPPTPTPMVPRLRSDLLGKKGQKIIAAVSFFGYPMGFPNAEGGLCMPTSKVSCSRFWPISYDIGLHRPKSA